MISLVVMNCDFLKNWFHFESKKTLFDFKQDTNSLNTGLKFTEGRGRKAKQLPPPPGFVHGVDDHSCNIMA